MKLWGQPNSIKVPWGVCVGRAKPLTEHILPLLEPTGKVQHSLHVESGPRKEYSHKQ